MILQDNISAKYVQLDIFKIKQVRRNVKHVHKVIFKNYRVKLHVWNAIQDIIQIKMVLFNAQNVKKGHFPLLRVQLHANLVIKEHIKINKGKINAIYVQLDNIMINLVRYPVINAR